MTGIILAGGENKRMGADKAFLMLNGSPLIDRIIAVVRGVADKIVIVTNAPECYRAYSPEITVVTDRIRNRGPLAGIYSGISSSGDDYNLVVACDMPFLNAELLAYMTRQAPGFDAVVPRIGTMTEPLHAIYSSRLTPIMEKLIERDERKIQSIYEYAGVRYLAEEEIRRFDPRCRSFSNLNTPQDYKEAVCSDSECRN